MAQILLQNVNKTPLKYSMENIASDVLMQVAVLLHKHNFCFNLRLPMVLSKLLIAN